MSRHHRASRMRLAWALIPVLAAGCMAGPSATHQAPPGPSQPTRIERKLTLKVDPQATTGQLRAMLSTIESQLNVDVTAADMRQANGNTTFRLHVSNRGSAVANLQLRLSSDRPLNTPANPIELGALGPGASADTAMSYANPAGSAFTVTIYMWATMAASGPQAADSGGVSALPSPSAAPTASPSPTPPNPTPSSPVATAPNPGPFAARGRILSNGQPAAGWGSLSTSYGRVELTLKRIVNNGWVQSIPVTTDAQGYFTRENLPVGDYIAYFYNEIHRDRMGVWKSLPVRVDASTGGAFPVVDLYLVGQQNTPLPGSASRLPATFTYARPVQPMASQRFRIHSQPGTSFALVYVSNKFPGDRTQFAWDGALQAGTLEPDRDYFWGQEWDGGPLGAFGNLYQKIRFVP